MAQAVEPFELELVSREQSLSSLPVEREGLWQQPGLFDQVNERQTD